MPRKARSGNASRSPFGSRITRPGSRPAGARLVKSVSKNPVTRTKPRPAAARPSRPVAGARPRQQPGPSRQQPGPSRQGSGSATRGLVGPKAGARGLVSRPKPQPAARPSTRPKPQPAARPSTRPKPQPAARPSTRPRPRRPSTPRKKSPGWGR